MGRDRGRGDERVDGRAAARRGEAGTLSSGDAHTLEEAFDLVTGLRLAHQVQQLREGQEPDDYVDPARLSKLTRTHLREAFRAIASIQKRISAELGGAVL